MHALIVILAAPLIGLFSGWLAGQRAGREKVQQFVSEWDRSRQDIAVTTALQLIQNLATDLASATHSMMWLTWKSNKDATRFSQDDIDQYNSEMHSLLPKILGAEVALHAINPSLAKRLRLPISKLETLDAKIGVRCVRFDGQNQREIAKLWADADNVHNLMIRELTGISERIVDHRRFSPPTNFWRDYFWY